MNQVNYDEDLTVSTTARWERYRSKTKNAHATPGLEATTALEAVHEFDCEYYPQSTNQESLQKT
jgi:hypothetical protein